MGPVPVFHTLAMQAKKGDRSSFRGRLFAEGVERAKTGPVPNGDWPLAETLSEDETREIMHRVGVFQIAQHIEAALAKDKKTVKE